MAGKRILIAGAVIGAFLVTAPEVSAEQGTEQVNLDLGQREELRNTWIFEVSGSSAQVSSLARSAVAGVGGRLKYTYSVGFVGFAAVMPQPAVSKLLEENPNIVSAVRDVAITTAAPPGACEPWPACKDGGDGGGDGGGDTTSSEIPWGTARVGGPFDCGVDGTACLPVYIMDTGIDADHADLNVDTTRSFGLMDSGGTNCTASADGNWQDENGHGTHVAGTVGALVNNQDSAGVAAGATVISARILDASGNGAMSDAVCAVNVIASQVGLSSMPTAVVNMSFMSANADDFDPIEQAITATIKDYGLLYAVAAGNNVLNGPPFLRTNYDASEVSPARSGNYERSSDNSADLDPGIWTVSAMDEQNNLADFSVSASTFVSPAAPGVGVVSSKLGGGTESKDGTSMAAPHVAGLLSACGGVADGGPVGNDGDGQTDPIAIAPTGC